MINFDDLLTEFLNPPVKESMFKKLIKSKESVERDLRERISKGEMIQNFVKSQMWRDFERPEIVEGLKNGFGKLIRDGLTMSEVEIKAVIADMRSKMSRIANMRYAVDDSEESKLKLAKLEQK